MQQYKIDEIIKEITNRCKDEEEISEVLAHLSSVNWTDVMVPVVALREKRMNEICCQGCKKTKDYRECERVITYFAVCKTTCVTNHILMCASCVKNAQCSTVTCKFCCKTRITTERIRGFICDDCVKIVEIVAQQNNRARLSGLPYTLTADQWKQTLDYFQEKCAYCDGEFQCVEHYIPVTLNGGTTVGNCVPACSRCNLKKNNRHPDQLDLVFPSENLARIREYLTSVVA